MPRITQIAINSTDGRTPEGLKRQVFDREYTGVDLLCGANGVGKTAQGPLGITAALEGLAKVPTDKRRPYIGALPASTSIMLALDTGEYVTRDLSASKGKAKDAADQLARSLIGIPPTAWDLADFSSGTDGQRGSILDAVARAGGSIEAWDRDTAIERVHQIIDAAHPPGPEWLHWVAPLDDCARSLSNAPDGATWLRSAEVWAIAQQSDTNATQKAANTYYEELGQTPPPKVAGNADEDNARTVELCGIKDSAMRVDTKAAKRYDDEGDRLAAECTRIKGAGVRMATPTPPIDPGYQKRVDEAQAAFDAPAVDLGPLETHLAELVEVRTQAEANHAEATGNREDLRAAYQNAKDDANAAASTLQAMSEVDASQTCAHCGESDPLDFGPKLAAARVVEAKCMAKLDPFKADATKADTAWLAAVGGLDMARHNVAQATLILAVESRATRDPKALLTAIEAATWQLSNERERHAELTQERGHDLADLRNQYKAAAKAHEEWTGRPRPATVTPDPGLIDTIDAELIAIADRRQARRDRDAHITQTRAAETRADTAAMTWEATKALLSAVRQARDDLAAAAYLPIHTAAQSLVAGAAGLPVPYFAGPTDYGAVIRGQNVPYHGLSESEQRITAACLVYALAVVAHNPVRIVLLDGLEVVTQDKRIPLLCALSRAQERGKVDNVIVTMATRPGEDLDGYRGIEGLTVHVLELQDRPTTYAGRGAAITLADDDGESITLPLTIDSSVSPF